MTDLTGRIAIVTGALSGIGRAIAETFSEAGATVVIFDMRDASRDDEMPGDELARSLGRDAMFLRGDVASETDVDRLFETVTERLGRVDIVVNNAGVTAFGPIEALTAEDFDHVMRVNVRGTFVVCKRAIATMRARGEGGVIVTVASNFAFVGASETSVYSSSKGAVATMTKALAVETGPEGIRINALCPGATATEFNRAHRARPEVLDDWRDQTPLRVRGREDFLASTQDIARAALFLAGDDSTYMTGSCLVCDGGWNAR